MTIAEEMRSILATRSGPHYQTHTWRGERLNLGVRGIERRDLIHPTALVGRRVLDLGCATGAECIWAVEHRRAAAVCGVELVPENASTARSLVVAAQLAHKIDIVCHDLRSGLPRSATDAEWDVVFVFALSHHLGYRRIWEEVPGARVAYVESGSPCNFDEATLSHGRWRAVAIGWTPNNATDPRPMRGLFRVEHT